MSSSPRSSASRTAIFALGVGAAIIVVSLLLLAFGVNVLKIGDTFVTGLFPPIAVTSEGAQIRDLYTVIFLIAVAIFLVVEGLIVWTVIRYRRKPGDDTLPPQIHGNNIAEFVWTVVPTLIVIFMFIVSWQTLNAVDTNASDAQTTKIRAVAGQFQWQFDYLDQNDKLLYTELLPLVSQGGGMMVPAGRTVQLSLVSHDVIHAFYVPQFLFKRDVVPGRTNQFDFTVDAADAGQTFRGQCAELCGIGHSIMLFEVKALAPQEFDTWLAGKAAHAAGRRPARGPRRRAAAHAARRRSASSSTGERHPVRREDPDGPGRRAVPDRVRQPGRERPAQRHDPQGLADGRAGLRRRHLPGRRQEDLQRAGPDGRDLLVCVCRPSDDDDRHPHGPVRSARWRRPP